MKIKEKFCITLNKFKSILQAIPYAWKASKKTFILLSVLLGIQGIVAPFYALLIGQSIAFLAHETTDLLPILVGWILVFAIDAGLDPLIYFVSSHMNEKMTLYVHHLILEKGLSLKQLTLFEDEEFYDSMHLMLSESKSRPTNYVVLYTYVLTSMFSVITYVVILVQVRWFLPFLVLLAGLPIARALERMREYNWIAIRRSQKDLRYVEEMGQLALTKKSFQEIQAFHAIPLIRNKFSEHANSYHTELKTMRVKSLLHALPGVLLGIFGYILSAYVILTLDAEHFSLAVLSSTFTAYFYLKNSIDTLIQNATFFSEKAYFFKDLSRFLSRSETETSSAAHKLLASQGATAARVSLASQGAAISHGLTPQNEIASSLKDGLAIRFDHVSFAYPSSKELALDDVSFSIRPQQMAVICGANGAGKSTISKLLLGFYIPTHGEIYINNTSLSSMDLDTYRQYVSVLFQDYAQYPFSIALNVSLKPESQTDHKKLNDSLSFAYGTADLDLSEQLDKRFGGRDLSGGQVQRLAIARMAYKDAVSGVVMDEPSAAIDPLREAELFDAITHSCKDKTAVIISHRLGITQHADIILVMDHGRLVEEGSFDELVARGGLFSRMLAEQLRSTAHVE